jgi:hypothetical protein
LSSLLVPSGQVVLLQVNLLKLAPVALQAQVSVWGAGQEGSPEAVVLFVRDRV